MAVVGQGCPSRSLLGAWDPPVGDWQSSPAQSGAWIGRAGGWNWDAALWALPQRRGWGEWGWVDPAPWRLAGLPPSSMIWKCRKWDYPGTDVHKGGEMESVTVEPAFDYL